MQITTVLSGRRSVRAFSQLAVTEEDMLALLEAARWAPSNGNRQPWRFVVTRRPEAVRSLGACLTPGNQWALRAPLLITLITRIAEGGLNNGVPYAIFDCGLATMSLIVEAETRGLRAHVMAGWKREPLVAAQGIPQGFDPLVVIAVGHPGDPLQLEEALREKELRPRRRRSLDEIWAEDRFSPGWDVPLIG